MQEIFSQTLRFIGQAVRKAGCLALGCVLAGMLLLCVLFAAGYGLFMALNSR
jgi:hypothetical protein